MRNQGFSSKEAAAIANGATASNAISYDGYQYGGFITPAALTSTAFTFKVCNTKDGTFIPLYNSSNTLISITVAVNRAYPLPAELQGFPFFQIIGGSTELADRSIVVTKKY